MRRLLRTIVKETGVPVHVLEIPPMDVRAKPGMPGKVAVYNRLLRASNIDGTKIVNTTAQYKEHTYEELLNEDGFHLSRIGQNIMKEAIEGIVRNESDKTREENKGESGTMTIFIDVQPDKAGLLIGRNGTRINIK